MITKITDSKPFLIVVLAIEYIVYCFVIIGMK